MILWSLMVFLVIAMAQAAEGMLFAWNPETKDYSKYMKATTEFVNIYLYGAFVIPLSDIQTPFNDHSSCLRAFAIFVFFIQRYQTLISTFVGAISVVAVKGAHSIACSAANNPRDDRLTDYEASYPYFKK